MTGLDAIVHIGGIQAAFQRLRKTDGRKVFREARQPVRVDLRDHARKAMSPGGKWAERAPSTRERRGNRRKLLGKAPGAFAITSGPDFVRAVWRRAWMKTLFHGGRVGHGSRLPARRADWVSRTLKRAVRDLFVQALKRSWAGR